MNGTSFEVSDFQRFNDAKNKLRQLKERWDNRLRIEKMSLLEEYRKGRLSIVFNLQPTANLDHVVSAGAIGYEGAISDLRALVVFCVNAGDGRHAKHGDQEPVFVDVVDFVEGPEGKIPSLVRLYVVENDVADIGSGMLYVSLFHGNGKVLPRFMEWKMDPRGFYSGIPNHLTGYMIKCGTEAMNSIAYNKRERDRKRLENLQLEDISARIVVHRNAIEIIHGGKLADAGINLVDVMVGPADL